eukprot:a841793_127.p3 GENE.a841793_127~~a841793_127.p3  ORF type:complete len:100 (+),score=25.20 a841793_127:36-302(+)
MSAEAPKVVIESAPFDYRFPHTNQAKNCWANFNMAVRCRMDNGVDHPTCLPFKKTYRSLCPDAWVKKWEEQLAAGTYPVAFTKTAAGH